MNNIKTDNSFPGEILVVEDDTDSLKYMSGLLAEANYQVRAANDGQLALRSIKSKLPDLIIMDINMPGMNGVEVCSRLKSDSATADIPVIFISAEDKTDLKVKAFKAGGIDYITKPIDPVEVLTRIDTHLNMYRLQNQLMAQSEQLLEEIKERIKAEQYLEENQLFLKASLESSKDMIILSLDQNYRYYFFNNTHAESMNHVFGTKPEIGKCIFDFMQSKDDIEKVKDHYDRALAGESHVVIEEYGEGNLRFYYEIQYNPMYNPENEIIGVTSFAQNITERINDQEKIKASLKEKETLLSEIHHRVKNNMQVIISMLRLQAGKAKDVEQVNILKESENRVLSMAMVHEHLYQSKDFSNIDFHDYINNLVNDLFLSYGVEVNKIKLNISCIDVFLDIENAIPCGLIINELVSNTLKYAFPDTEEGEIDISVLSVNKDEFELTVSDNGVGISKDIDINNTDSMGLNLVRVLSEETLEGKMKLDRDNGTKFHFQLKRTKYKSRI